MNYAEIKTCDIANGPGGRVSLFVSGCTHHCKGCFNEEAWDFACGKPFTEQTEPWLLKELEPEYIRGLTLLGGEPMEPENQKALLPFLEKVRAALPGKSWFFRRVSLFILILFNKDHFVWHELVTRFSFVLLMRHTPPSYLPVSMRGHVMLHVEHSS